ncbi:unnamed protein product [Caenorhabditis sp. 36 PRJEB53466]|nr:unnamed protein product [Caenorhabditis sp. 36 PRJEB53466]
MLFRFGLFLLFLYGFQSQKTSKVQLTVFRKDYTDLDRLVLMMRIGRPPPNHSHRVVEYQLDDIICDKSKIFQFSIRGQMFKCPVVADPAERLFNITHGFSCPTFCQVCTKAFICTRSSLSGIIYTPDGRKKDDISVQYGFLDQPVERPINWIVFTVYVIVFAVLLNAMAYMFSDQ